jgi:hypothetical protein
MAAEDLGVDRRILLNWMKGVAWIDLARDVRKWRGLVYTLLCGCVVVGVGGCLIRIAIKRPRLEPGISCMKL